MFSDSPPSILRRWHEWNLQMMGCEPIRQEKMARSALLYLAIITLFSFLID
jgi:hypothetical protein